MYSRRELGKIAAALFPLSIALGKPDSRVNGVQLGAQSNSFSDRSLDEALKALVEIGIGECELWQGHVEPRPQGRGQAGIDLRKWREETPASYFGGIARKFKEAAIRLYDYDYQFHENFEDQEIERGFLMAKALGVRYMVTSSATISLAKRMAPFAEKHRITVGMHGRTNLKDPNEFARPESYETVLGYSKYIGINLDIGHYVAAGFDPLPFIEKHHARIVSLHLKDRKKDQGPSMPFGQGDTPIKEVLQLLKKNKWDIPAQIEYDVRGGDRVADFRKAYEYCKQALA
jgi:sugar phosphate isomerase/epimerase